LTASKGQTKKKPRGMTSQERIAWMERLRSDEDAVRKDLPDLTSFMLGTGVRMGEALAVLWSEIDLQTRTVSITSTIIRVKGVGLLRVPTKSRAGQRVLVMPSWVVAMLTRRFAEGIQLDKPVFPDSRGGYRDPSNTSRDLREARGAEDLSWVTSHVFRKTMATMLDDAGLSAREVADQLGHARPSLTQDVYMARNVVSPRAAQAVEGALEALPDENAG
jgi:integrase